MPWPVWFPSVLFLVFLFCFILKRIRTNCSRSETSGQIFRTTPRRGRTTTPTTCPRTPSGRPSGPSVGKTSTPVGSQTPWPPDWRFARVCRGMRNPDVAAETAVILAALVIKSLPSHPSWREAIGNLVYRFFSRFFFVWGKTQLSSLVYRSVCWCLKLASSGPGPVCWPAVSAAGAKFVIRTRFVLDRATQNCPDRLFFRARASI